MHYKQTDFGFEWGALKIERCCSDGKKGWIIVALKTLKTEVHIRVTKSGKLRIHAPAMKKD